MLIAATLFSVTTIRHTCTRDNDNYDDDDVET